MYLYVFVLNVRLVVILLTAMSLSDNYYLFFIIEYMNINVLMEEVLLCHWIDYIHKLFC